MKETHWGKLNWMWRNAPLLYSQYTPDGSAWPRLSIITPSFNQGRFLEETIRSVLYQGYPNLEYIVIDGGSTDHSVEIIRKYEDRIAYWVSEKDRGQADAVNKGLAVATGEIIGWINSDDIYTKHSFRTVVSRFLQSPDLGLAYGGRILIDEDSYVSGWLPSRTFDPDSTGFNICSETAFWRRSPDDPRLRDDLRFAMDLELFVRLSRARKSQHLNEFLGCFRCYGENKSSTMQDVCRAETVNCWERVYGTGHNGWVPKKQISRPRMLWSFLSNPCSIAIPYLYRRLVLGKRGNNKRNDV